MTAKLELCSFVYIGWCITLKSCGFLELSIKSLIDFTDHMLWKIWSDVFWCDLCFISLWMIDRWILSKYNRYNCIEPYPRHMILFSWKIVFHYASLTMNYLTEKTLPLTIIPEWHHSECHVSCCRVVTKYVDAFIWVLQTIMSCCCFISAGTMSRHTLCIVCTQRDAVFSNFHVIHFRSSVLYSKHSLQ